MFAEKIEGEVEADSVVTVPEAGWASKRNGELLRLAETDFDVLLTHHQNMEHQQILESFNFGEF